jgi:hypothetical protein
MCGERRRGRGRRGEVRGGGGGTPPSTAAASKPRDIEPDRRPNFDRRLLTAFDPRSNSRPPVSRRRFGPPAKPGRGARRHTAGPGRDPPRGGPPAARALGPKFAPWSRGARRSKGARWPDAGRTWAVGGGGRAGTRSPAARARPIHRWRDMRQTRPVDKRPGFWPISDPWSEIWADLGPLVRDSVRDIGQSRTPGPRFGPRFRPISDQGSNWGPPRLDDPPAARAGWHSAIPGRNLGGAVDFGCGKSFDRRPGGGRPGAARASRGQAPRGPPARLGPVCDSTGPNPEAQASRDQTRSRDVVT